MCVAIIVALWLLGQFKPLGLPKPRLWLATESVAAGIALCPISNFAITDNFAFTPGGSSFLFGRLIEDGIVARYLGEHCPDAALRLCGYQANLPEDADELAVGRQLTVPQTRCRERLSAPRSAPLRGRRLSAIRLCTPRQPPSLLSNSSLPSRRRSASRITRPRSKCLRDHFPQLFAQFMRAANRPNVSTLRG